MNYTVVLSTKAQRGFRKLPADVQARVREALLALQQAPRPHGCLKMKGRKNEWRVRVGDYRIVYTIDDRARLVEAVDIGPRRDVYDR